jgi:hypothetical protein
LVASIPVVGRLNEEQSGSPERSSKSKPTWWDTSGCSATSAFFIGFNRYVSLPSGERRPCFRFVYPTAALPQGVFMGLLLLILVILLLVGGLPTWTHSRNWGYGPSGGLGLLLVILLVLIVFTDVIRISRF